MESFGKAILTIVALFTVFPVLLAWHMLKLVLTMILGVFAVVLLDLAIVFGAIWD